jgi:hypothetical protein
MIAPPELDQYTQWKLKLIKEAYRATNTQTFRSTFKSMSRRR